MNISTVPCSPVITEACTACHHSTGLQQATTQGLPLQQGKTDSPDGRDLRHQQRLSVVPERCSYSQLSLHNPSAPAACARHSQNLSLSPPVAAVVQGPQHTGQHLLRDWVGGQQRRGCRHTAAVVLGGQQLLLQLPLPAQQRQCKSWIVQVQRAVHREPRQRSMVGKSGSSAQQIQQLP